MGGALLIDAELFILIGIGFGIVYGLQWAHQQPSIARTALKTIPVSLLAIAALGAAPPLVTIALVLSAAGDAFLAGDGRPRLALGLGAFLLAHIAYIVLFLGTGINPNLAIDDPWRGAAIGAAIVIAAGLGRWLWPDLGGLRWAVAAYILAILGMVVLSLLLAPVHHRLAPLGAALFMASDALLSVRLFKPDAWAQSRLATVAVWFLYFAGQTVLTFAFLH